ncbi:MAG: putative toxin-antitoxin system toxin component, PIN family [Ginsengibacter sp.]
MKIVLDTNLLIIAIGIRSRYRPIWQAFIEGKYQLIISEEIIHEYEEILLERSARGASEIVMQVFAESPDIIYKRIHYTWKAITSDPDDNKFFDTAVAGNADYLVTNDGHFKEALAIGFPRINIISAEDFLKVLGIAK